MLLIFHYVNIYWANRLYGKCGPKHLISPYLILFLICLLFLLPLSLLKEDGLIFWPGMFLKEEQNREWCVCVCTFQVFKCLSYLKHTVVSKH